MRVGRLLLVVATIATVMVFPLLMHEAVAAFKLPSAYAAPNIFDTGGRTYQNGNQANNDDDDGGSQDDDDNGDQTDNEGESEENENNECFLNLNDNEPVPCDDEEDNTNDNEPEHTPAAEGAEPAPAPAETGYTLSASRCFGVTETGDLFLDAPDYDVTLAVVNALGSDTQLGLNALDPSTVPGPPAGRPLLDAAVFQVDALAGCGGGAIAQFPAVNLGFSYSIGADKSKLQIVHLENGSWVEVPTFADPDPNNPYISATIQQAGTYAVVQKP